MDQFLDDDASLQNEEGTEHQQQQDTPEQEPKRVTIKLGDYEVEVDEHVAQSFTEQKTRKDKERDDNYFRKISEQGARIHQLEQQNNQRTAQPQGQQAPVDPNAQWYLDPVGTMEKREQALRDEYEQQRAAEAQQRKVERYAETFYSNYSYLDNDEAKALVAAVYNRHVNDLQGLPENISHAMLADLVDKYASTLTGSAVVRERNTPPNSTRTTVNTKPTTSERSSTTTTRPAQTKQTSQKTQPNSDDPGFDLVEYLRKESERRRKAFLNVND